MLKVNPIGTPNVLGLKTLPDTMPSSPYLTFSEALVQLKAGRQVKRRDSGIWIHMDEDGNLRELDFSFGFPDSTLWEPSQAAVLAEDYEVRETPPPVERTLVE